MFFSGEPGASIASVRDKLAANFDAQPVVDVARDLEDIGRACEFDRAPAALERLRAETDRLLATLRSITI